MLHKKKIIPLFNYNIRLKEPTYFGIQIQEKINHFLVKGGGDGVCAIDL